MGVPYNPWQVSSAETVFWLFLLLRMVGLVRFEIGFFYGVPPIFFDNYVYL